MERIESYRRRQGRRCDAKVDVVEGKVFEPLESMPDRRRVSIGAGSKESTRSDDQRSVARKRHGGNR